jgi:acyl-CoA reductase-like NAD-dependent aldehyde dehydrogenase
MTTFNLTIDGKPAATKTTFDVLNPADESVVAACPQGNTQLVDAAVAAARRAFPMWSALPDAERVAKLNAMADLIEKHHKELAELVTREQVRHKAGRERTSSWAVQPPGHGSPQASRFPTRSSRTTNPAR